MLVYDAAALRDAMTDDDARRDVHAELARALADGPGIAVFRGAFEHDVARPGERGLRADHRRREGLRG